MTYPVGQVVGDLHGPTSCRDIVRGMLEEFADSVDRLSAIVS
jgi:hypothetical protein